MTTSVMPQASRVEMMPRVARSATTRVAEAAPDAVIYMLGIAAVFASWRLQEMIPGAGSLKLPVVTLLLAMMAFFASRSITQIARVAKEGPLKWVLVLATLAILGGPNAIVRGIALNFVLFDFAPTLLLCIFLAAAIRSERDARCLLGMFVLGGVVFCLYSRKTAYMGGGRPGGLIFYDANDLALLASCTCAVGLALAHTSRTKILRFFWFACAVVMLSTVLWTISRGGFLSIVSMAGYLTFSPIMPAAKRTTFLVVGLAGLLVAGGKTYIQTMNTILHPEEDYNFASGGNERSENGRGELWKRGRGYVYQRPLMGSGVRNYTAAEGHSAYAKAKFEGGKGHKWSRAHNSYLEIAVEMGVPGMLAFMAMIFGTIVRLHKKSRLMRGAMTDSQRLAAYLASSLIAFCVGGYFLSGEYWPMLYILVGISTVLTMLPNGRGEPGAAGPANGRPSRLTRARPARAFVGAPAMASQRASFGASARS